MAWKNFRMKEVFGNIDNNWLWVQILSVFLLVSYGVADWSFDNFLVQNNKQKYDVSIPFWWLLHIHCRLLACSWIHGSSVWLKLFNIFLSIDQTAASDASCVSFAVLPPEKRNVFIPGCGGVSWLHKLGWNWHIWDCVCTNATYKPLLQFPLCSRSQWEVCASGTEQRGLNSATVFTWILPYFFMTLMLLFNF